MCPVRNVTYVLGRSDPTNKKATDRADGQLQKPLQLKRFLGAGEGARTLDPDLGKVVLYH
jgi:hypothetical protein